MHRDTPMRTFRVHHIPDYPSTISTFPMQHPTHPSITHLVTATPNRLPLFPASIPGPITDQTQLHEHTPQTPAPRPQITNPRAFLRFLPHLLSMSVGRVNFTKPPIWGHFIHCKHPLTPLQQSFVCMKEDQDFFGISDPDELSYSRVRHLSTTDPEEVMRAVSGTKEENVFRIRNCQLSVTPLPIIGVILFCLFYMIPIFSDHPTAHTCLAILIFGGYLWATDVIPSYITAYLIPFLAVWFAIGYDPETGLRMSASALATDIASKFMDPIIFVFLGSLAMSAALVKLKITDRVSSFALSKISPRPSVILMTIMLLNFSAAAFLSNIASTTLFLTFSLPIVRSLDPDDNFVKALLFGLAWSGNAGGMVTTIASVQNILAIKYINESGSTPISFIEWSAFAGPTAAVILLLTYLYIRIRYKTRVDTIVVETRADFGPWTWQHTFTCVVTLVTILLWALQETFSSFFGHVGITALIPLITLFSTKILNADDFGHLRWSTLSLMGGGIALGETMRVSQLLDLLSDGLSKMMKGIPMWVVIFIFLIMEALLVSVINHTSAAAVLFPVLGQIGTKLFDSPTMFLTLSALMIANAQLFHISSFPTALVSGVQKHVKGEPQNLLSEPIISGPEFFFAGWPVVAGSVVVIASIGYGIVYLLRL